MRTLVVDDELVSRKKMIRILSEFGPCDSVKSGNAAVSVIKTAIEEKKRYDLITLDVSMPDIDGTQVLFTLREIEQVHGILNKEKAKVLMVTAHSDIDTVKACAGKCNGYVVKPFNKEIMIEKMTKIGLF